VPYIYEYLGEDQDLVVESDEPRPDLLEWAYWREIPAPAAKAKPEPVETVEATPAVKPVRKPRATKAAEGE
jgi:hypothetical protein